jgi:hypothetical protein
MPNHRNRIAGTDRTLGFSLTKPEGTWTNLHVQDSRLVVKDSAGPQTLKNQVWQQIKLIDPASAPAVKPAAPEMKTCTVQSGNTLSKIEYEDL